MDLISEMKRMLVSLTTPPYYYVVSARHGTASWRVESAIAYALYVSGLGATEEPKRLGATRVTLNKKASAIEDAVTRYSRTELALEAHTDSSQQRSPQSIVLFGMSRPDLHGGENQIVTVDELVKTLPSDLICELQKPIWPLGKKPKSILNKNKVSNCFEISYYRKQLDRSVELGALLTNTQRVMLDHLDDKIQALASNSSVKLQRGETLVLNNHKVLHGRSALASDSNRVMIRYRLSVNLAEADHALGADAAALQALKTRLIEASHRLEAQGRSSQATVISQGIGAIDDPSDPLSIAKDWCTARDFDRAKPLLMKILNESPENFDAPYYLSAISTHQNDDERAKHFLTLASQRKPFLKRGRHTQKPIVLKVRPFEGTKVKFKPTSDVKPGTRLVGGQLSTKYWIDKRQFHVMLGNAVDETFGDTAAPHFDVFFNAISDVDASPTALKGVDNFIAAHSPGQIINHPDALRRTQRNIVAGFARDTEGLWAGQTLRIPSEALASPDKAVSLIEAAMPYPILTRSAGTHTGSTLSLSKNRASLATALNALKPHTDAYATEFVDISDASGVFQKIRCFFIDGQLYPIHNLRSYNWEVGRRGDRLQVMSRESWMRDDEIHCLDQFDDYLGRERLTALTHFMTRIGLDFCGVDFGIAPQGQVVIFEANPAMRHHYDHVTTAPYIEPAHDRATQAFNDMLNSRITHIHDEP